ncbi:hypothetical protein [Xenorhabdus kozodoii]|uniref:hypothetical protein n=1 Tax=Xenorhabdus kozodoii TaxID=351676 RepID=UPI001FC995A5|nr:hypothetical protein [Xenorhabdus kozodoii]
MFKIRRKKRVVKIIARHTGVGFQAALFSIPTLSDGAYATTFVFNALNGTQSAFTHYSGSSDHNDKVVIRCLMSKRKCFQPERSICAVQCQQPHHAAAYGGKEACFYGDEHSMFSTVNYS